MAGQGIEPGTPAATLVRSSTTEIPRPISTVYLPPTLNIFFLVLPTGANPVLSLIDFQCNHDGYIEINFAPVVLPGANSDRVWCS